MGLKRNQWGPAKVLKVDGDYRSYTILYITINHTVGGQTPFRLKMRDEKVGAMHCTLYAVLQVAPSKS